MRNLCTEMGFKEFLKKVCNAFCLCIVFCVCGSEQKKELSKTFFKAAESGNVKKLRKLMKVKKTTEDKASPSLLTNISSSVNSTNKLGETPLTVACKLGNLEVVRYLVEHCQANVNQAANIFFLRYRGRGTPLHAAVMSGNLDLVRYLVKEQYANVNAKTEPLTNDDDRTHNFEKGNNTSLHLAAFFLKGDKRNSMIRFLKEKGSDMYFVNKNGCLAWTVSNDMGLLLNLFIELGYDPNYRFLFKERNRTTAHIWATAQFKEALDVINELLDAGADFSLKDENGLTPLMLAAVGKNGIINPKMFQRIFNGTSHKMNEKEKIAALELIGASYINQFKEGDKTDQISNAIDWYWKTAVELRFKTPNNIIESSLMTKHCTSMSESIKELDLLKEKSKNNPIMRKYIRSQAIDTMTRILGSDSPYVQTAIKSFEKKVGVHGLIGVGMEITNLK